MQQVGDALPLNGYLHSIQKHPAGDCPWCPGKKETQGHFQCKCKEFEKPHTLAHHGFARALIFELREQKPDGWQFWYETPIAALSWTFAWANAAEARKQMIRRPDGVAWHRLTGHVIFLEVSRPMDHFDNMAKASAQKGEQYSAAMEALCRAQRQRATQKQTSIVSTLPLLVGVRGTVEYDEAHRGFGPFKLKPSQVDKVLAAGIRAAITGASDMISARTAALPHAQRGRRRQQRAAPSGAQLHT